ncbi:MAG: signal peptide peptidase SppA [Casimicrobiaceae bacterium]|nr:signal peptide peptidase SppA [Casimicrobiaceae bacterium]MCX8098360.1 signal peptide peptidase SppA [Casimicrobiaceae bacterium]MDW8312524.1 signal peptide peptidase SppA [Burkholderiales bacterium]
MNDEHLPARDGWERELLSKLAFEQLRESRARRRWSVFFRLSWLTLAIVVLAHAFDWWPDASREGSTGRHTALVKLEGAIDEQARADPERIVEALRTAFKATESAAVVLSVNSPGGSPVYAARLYAEIRRLRTQYPDKPLFVVIDEICASGCYYVAAAADRIYAAPASLVGSIGVVYQGIGADKLIEKIGIENRTLTAGEHKAFLDPLAPLRPEHRAHMESVLAEVHQQFVRAVKEGRGNRLRESPSLFSGLVWSGAQALQLGLIDGLASVDEVAREVVKAEDVLDYTPEESPIDRFARRLGASFGQGLVEVLSRATVR